METTMRLLIFGVVLTVVMTTTNVMAYGGKNETSDCHDMEQKIWQELGLNEKQKSQLKEERQQLEDIRNSKKHKTLTQKAKGVMSPKTFKKEALVKRAGSLAKKGVGKRAKENAIKNEMFDVLTPEQQTKFKALQSRFDKKCGEFF